MRARNLIEGDAPAMDQIVQGVVKGPYQAVMVLELGSLVDWVAAIATAFAAGLALWQILALRWEQRDEQRRRTRVAAMLIFEEAFSVATRVEKWSKSTATGEYMRFPEAEDLERLRVSLADLPARQVRRSQRLHTNLVGLNRTIEIALNFPEVGKYFLWRSDAMPGAIAAMTPPLVSIDSVEFQESMMRVGRMAASLAIELQAIAKPLLDGDRGRLDQVHAYLAEAWGQRPNAPAVAPSTTPDA